MPTEVTIEQASAPTGRAAMCLRHADFHVMDFECEYTALGWHKAHDHLEGQEASDAYQAAVERRMLDQLVRSVGGIITP